MSEGIIQAVRTKYGQVAASGLSSDDNGARAVAEAFGYTTEELRSIPAEANMGLSCGNPTATAHLRPGEVVVDLGCGGGLDVFLAAARVGPTGKAIGIDMTPEMIDRARRNAARGVDGRPITNVEFHLAAIDRLPLPDHSVDCVISNCVINLAPDKAAVFREMARVLKPGGRVAISDIALKQELPAELAESVAAYVGCIAGATSIEAYREGLAAAGFESVEVVDSGKDLNAYALVKGQSACCSPAGAEKGAVQPAATTSGCCGSSLPVAAATCCSGNGLAVQDDTRHEQLAAVLSRHNVNDYAASVRVFAIKPQWIATA